MTATWQMVPLITIHDTTAQLQIENDALQTLAQLHASSVQVLGFFGPPATGKRLLLRTFLHYDAPLTIKSEQKVALWLWKQDEANEATKIVLVAGNEIELGTTVYHQTLALLFLLSSTLLYNEDGEINGQAIDKLAWIASLSQWIRIRANQDDATVAQELSKYAPKFIWLARNCKIKWLTNENGEKLSSTEYLESCMMEESGYSEVVMQRNTLRAIFHGIFSHYECIGLSRAVEVNETPDANLSRSALRSQFVEAVDKMHQSCLNTLRSKRLMEKALDSDQWLMALETYVDAINSKNRRMVIQHVINKLLQQSVDETFAKAEQSYKDATYATWTAVNHEKQPFNARDLLKKHLAGYQTAQIKLKELEARLPEQTRKTIYKDSWTKWEKAVKDGFESVLKTNQEISNSNCQALLQTMLPRNLEEAAETLASKPRESFPDGLTTILTEYKADLKLAIDSYKAQGAGPSLFVVLEQVLLTTIFDAIKAWGIFVLRQYQHHIQTMEKELMQLESDCQVANVHDSSTTFSTEDQKRLYEEQLAQSTDQLSQLRNVLRDELETKKSELERLMDDMTMMNKKHEARVRNTEDDLAYVRSKISDLEKAAMDQRSQLMDDVTGTTQEILVKERSYHQEERQLLTQQKELMARIVELERELVQKKTKHVQQVFLVESENAKRIEELKLDQAEFARQLRSQAKTDTGILKLAYQKKKTVVQNEMDLVTKEIAAMEEKLQAFDASMSSSRTSSRHKSKPQEAPTPQEFPASKVPAPVPAIDVSTSAHTIGNNTVTRTATTHPDSEMCRQS